MVKTVLKYVITVLLVGCGFNDLHRGRNLRDTEAISDEEDILKVLGKVEEALTWPDGRELEVPYQENLDNALKRHNPEGVFTEETTQKLIGVVRNGDLGESEIRYGILLPLESSMTNYVEQKVTDVEVFSGKASVIVSRTAQNWEDEWGLLQIEFVLVKTSQGWRVVDIIRKSYYGRKEDDHRLIRETSMLREIDRLSQRGR
ncbi:hypothetical protein [Haloferula sp. A504]|uniref:hypothetical protein n=1 Tax=Haloferula sp. A504 TaxID=3373601 RepID=UPI0031C5509D|nr:hypothetical protein [Verrucomicrobiaceae bacterium E54]